MLALETFKLPALDGVDALLDQFVGFLALVACFGKADGGIVAQREPRSLAAQLEAVAPSLYSVRLHFEVEAVQVIQAVSCAFGLAARQWASVNVVALDWR